MADKTKTLRPYVAYRFRAHDPVIDVVMAAKDDKGVKATDLSKDSGVSTNTFYNWKKRKTRRPQFATVVATARALGIEKQVALLIGGNRYR